MNKYELTVVLSGKSTPAKQKSITEKIKKYVDLFKGKLEETKGLGKVDLSYKIRGNESGIFLFFNVELESIDVKKFDTKLRSEEEIIRYLLIKK